MDVTWAYRVSASGFPVEFHGVAVLGGQVPFILMVAPGRSALRTLTPCCFARLQIVFHKDNTPEAHHCSRCDQVTPMRANWSLQAHENVVSNEDSFLEALDYWNVAPLQAEVYLGEARSYMLGVQFPLRLPRGAMNTKDHELSNRVCEIMAESLIREGNVRDLDDSEVF